MLRDFWKDFSAAVDDIKELRVTDVLDALNEELAPLVFPAREDGSRSAHLPELRHRQAVAEARQVRRLRRLLELSRMQLHPPARRRRQRQWRGRTAEDGDKVLGKDPYTREEITLRTGRFGPYVQRGDGKEAKRSSLPKGWTVDADRPRKGAGAAVAAARRRRASGKRQDDLGRPRPLRAVRPA